MNWKIAKRNFEGFLMLERSLSPNSIEAYLRDVTKLQQFLELQALDIKSPLKVQEKHISDFLAWLNSIGIAAKSQARMLSGLKTFYKFLMLEDLLDAAPTDFLETPRMEQSIPDFLTFSEVGRILSAFDMSTNMGLRNRAIVEMLYGCGMRVSELCGLRLSHYFPETGIIRIMGKGNKERLIPVSPDAQKHTNYYLSEVRSRQENITKKGEDILFLNNRGNQLSRVMIFLIIKDAVLAAGIEKVVSPHTFRHTFATHLIEGGADLRAIQDMLGHESITTTEIYTHLDTEYLRETIQMFHPRNKKRTI